MPNPHVHKHTCVHIACTCTHSTHASEASLPQVHFPSWVKLYRRNFQSQKWGLWSEDVHLPLVDLFWGKVYRCAWSSVLMLFFLCPAVPLLAVMAVVISPGTMPPIAGSCPAPLVWLQCFVCVLGGLSPHLLCSPLWLTPYPISSLSASLVALLLTRASETSWLPTLLTSSMFALTDCLSLGQLPGFALSFMRLLPSQPSLRYHPRLALLSWDGEEEQGWLCLAGLLSLHLWLLLWPIWPLSTVHLTCCIRAPVLLQVFPKNSDRAAGPAFPTAILNTE